MIRQSVSPEEWETIEESPSEGEKVRIPDIGAWETEEEGGEMTILRASDQPPASLGPTIGAPIGAEPYISALMRASGITGEQARTCFYYAVATYLLPEKINPMPILAIIGPLGTGKSSLLSQLARMVNGPKLIGAESIATLRDDLSNTITALIDEGDNVYEPHLVKRYERETARVTYKAAANDRVWKQASADIFGATIIARRTPFSNAATKSRSLVISTHYRPGDYEITTDISKEGIMTMAGKVEFVLKVSQRVRNNWLPLQAVAISLGDNTWISYSELQIAKDIQDMMVSQSFEPDEAVLVALSENMVRGGVETDVLISTLKSNLRHHFDLNLKSIQIQEICRSLGFRVASSGGYPKVKSDGQLLHRLLAEKKLGQK